jgi:hypothetical protein
VEGRDVDFPPGETIGSGAGAGRSCDDGGVEAEGEGGSATYAI